VVCGYGRTISLFHYKPGVRTCGRHGSNNYALEVDSKCRYFDPALHSHIMYARWLINSAPRPCRAATTQRQQVAPSCRLQLTITECYLPRDRRRRSPDFMLPAAPTVAIRQSRAIIGASTSTRCIGTGGDSVGAEN